MGETPVSGIGDPGAVDFVTLYLAARVLKAAGFDAEAAKVLREVYGVKVTVEQVEKWFTSIPPEIMKKSSPLRLTVTLTREKLPLMAYLAGVMIGDGDLHRGRGRLRVKDKNLAKACARKLSKLINRKVKARRQKDGFYSLENTVLSVIRNLWKILAYINQGKRRYLLSGLLDAEAAISPHLVNKGDPDFRLQITFVNTNPEIAHYVMNELKMIGLKPRLRIVQRNKSHTINGKHVIHRKPLYVVHTLVTPARAQALTQLKLYCKRKRMLIRFFLEVKDMSSHARHQVFLLCWKKKNGRWVPISNNILELKLGILLQYGVVKARRPIKQLGIEVIKQFETKVKCPKCGQEGTFLYHKKMSGKSLLVRLYVVHEDTNQVCELDAIEGVKEGKKVAYTCKCGQPGHLYIVTVRRISTIYVYIRHHTRQCYITRLPPAKPETTSPNPTPPTTQDKEQTS